MWQILHHLASVCALTQPIRFETEDGSSFARPLPTPVCLVSFDADLAPGASNCVSIISLIRLHSCEASVSSVLEKVRMYTGGWCESIAPPIRSDALQDAAKAQHSCAALLPARMTNTNVKELLFKAHHVAFLSPPLIDTQEGETRRRCVEGSLIAFFSENPSTFLHNTSARPIRFSMLSPTSCITC
jgi:hypothetical protein